MFWKNTRAIFLNTVHTQNNCSISKMSSPKNIEPLRKSAAQDIDRHHRDQGRARQANTTITEIKTLIWKREADDPNREARGIIREQIVTIIIDHRIERRLDRHRQRQDNQADLREGPEVKQLLLATTRSLQLIISIPIQMQNLI